MKILLIRPKPHKETIGLQNVMICEPLELMTLAAVLKNNGHEVEIIDMILEKKPVEFIIRLHNPDAVGLTGYISHIGVIKSYAAGIKSVDPKIKVIAGGVHAAVCPEDFDDINIDLVARSAADLYEYLGCADLSERLPFRNLTERYMKRYYYLFQENCALIKTSFGCPYNCNFCFCKEIAPYSARPVDDVIDEIKSIPQREIYIVDDDFLFNRGRLLEFAEKIKRDKIDKHFLVYGRADFIAGNEDVIKILSETGLTAVIVGIEASSQEELDSYDKKTKLDENINAIGILQKYGIECYATVILGADWGREEFKRLYKFIKENKLIFVNLQPLTPMPHTPFFEEYKDRLIIPYDEHEKWDMAHLVIKPGKLSTREYYWNILLLYYKITISPKNIAYMFKRYGVRNTMKLSVGAAKITVQYLKKIRGAKL
ncbi:MAG: B12-binding domain-containing radical SAM protein [Saccharofermentanales bacterium]